jgi:hypothetical protein
MLFKAGKNQEGYFTNSDILNHATAAMDILEKHYPDEDHVFVFDNATTHLKHKEDALSATKMPKNVKEWGITANKLDEDCNPVYRSDSRILKMQVHMDNSKFANGEPQHLYFPAGHPCAGEFKGMAEILIQRGFTHAHSLNMQCEKFKCKYDATNCRCHQMLYLPPDFINMPPILEKLCTCHEYQVLFLLKFHCKLNFIEKC